MMSEEKTMKKTLSLILTLLMCSALMSACIFGSGSTEEDPTSRTRKNATTAEAETTAEATTADVATVEDVSTTAEDVTTTAQAETTTAEAVGESTIYTAIYAAMYGTPCDLEFLGLTKGTSMTLNDQGGQAIFDYDGTIHKMEYTLEGENFHIADQYNAMDGSLKDGILVLKQVFKSNMDLIFVTDAVSQEVIAHILAGGDPFGEGGGEAMDPALAGRYEAIAACVGSDSEEVPLPEGEYFIINEDGSVSLFFDLESTGGLTQFDYETQIRDGKIYLNEDLKVGEFRPDGSVILAVNDEVNYIYAKEGSAPWQEWQSWLASQPSSSAPTDNPGPNNFGYDMEVAKQFIGDWQGILLFNENAEYNGQDWSNVNTNVFCRIVIDEAGEPLVFFRAILPDEMNFENTVAIFDEEGYLLVMGDFAGIEWWDVLVLDENGYFELWGSDDDDNELFRAYFRPLDVLWDEDDMEYLPDAISDEDFAVYNRNIQQLEGYGLKEILEIYEESLNSDQNQVVYDLRADALPDEALLDLYK